MSHRRFTHLFRRVPRVRAIMAATAWSRALAVCCTLVLMSTRGHAQGDPVYQVSVTPDGQAVTANPGAASYTFTVRNTGNVNDSYTLTASCSGAASACTPAVSWISINKAVSKSVVVNYTAAAAGGTGTVTLRATSTFDASSVDTGFINITVPQLYTVTVTPHSATDTVFSYSPASRAFTVQNTGSQSATYLLRNTCSGVAVQNCQLAPASVTLNPTQQATATVTYSPGSPGDTGSVRLTAKYSGDTTLSDNGLVKVYAKDPCVTQFDELTPCTATMLNPASTPPGMEHDYAITHHHPMGETGSFALRCIPSGAVQSCRFTDYKVRDLPVQSIAVKADSTGHFTLRFTTIGSDTVGTIKVIATDIDSMVAVVNVRLQTPADPGGAGGANLLAFDLTPDYQTITTDRGVTVNRFATLTNRGTRADTFVVTRSCTGAAVSTACTPASEEQILSAGAAISLPVTFTTTSVVGASGSAVLTVARKSNGGTVDSSRFDVTIATPPTNAVEVTSVNPGVTIERNLCLTVGAGSAAGYECGDLRVAHTLPPTMTLGKVRAPTLLYNSRHADPRPIVAALITVPSAGPLPDSVTAQIRIAGATVASGKWLGSDWRLGEIRRIALDFDGRTYVTGVYHYVLTAKRYQGGSIIPDSANGDLVIVNRNSSPFGAGWWLAGLEQLVLRGDTALWVGGDGSARQYLRDPAAPTVWRAQLVDQRDSITWDATRQIYSRNLPNRLHVEFNAAGQHVSTVNRLGHTTTFAYNGATNRCLTSITVPPAGTARTYQFAYNDNCASTSSRLTTVVAPGSGSTRQTTVAINVAQQVDSIVDPDSYTVKFAYAMGYTGRMTSRTDRRGTVTSYTYGAGNLLRDVKIAIDTGAAGVISTTFVPQESRGLTGQAAVAVDDAYRAVDGPRSDVSDTSKFWLDRFGAPTRIRNALGDETILYRTEARFPALVTKVRAPSGAISVASYDTLGRVVQQVDSSSCNITHSLCATTTYTWNGDWHIVATITPPEGLGPTFGYDAVGNRIWQQPGTDSTRRVTFGYHPTLKLPTSTLLPGATQRDSIDYDVFGNVRFTQSERGPAYRTVFYKDSIGRDTLVVAPIDVGANGAPGSLFMTQRTVYDKMGQDTLVVRTRPTISLSNGGSAAATHYQRKRYDPEGNLLSHKQWLSPNPNAVDSIAQSWEYDRANRQTKAIAPRALRFPNANYDLFSYDAAGNVVAHTTRSGFVIQSQYDALNRLLWSVVPQRGIGFPTGYTWGTRIPADTTRYVFDGANMIGAANIYSRITRRYNQSGSLLADTLRIRTADTLRADFATHVYGQRYGYDLTGRRIWLKYPAILAPAQGQDSIAYSYDPVFGGIAWAEDMFRNRQNFSYDIAGRLASRAMPGGVTARYYYNADGSVWRRTEDNGPLLHDDSLFYDARGKITYAGVLIAGGAYDSFSMSYDGFGALTYSQSYNEMKRTETTTLDALQNIVSVRSSGQGGALKTSATTYEPGTGQLLKMLSNGGDWQSDTATYDYDGDGNRTYATDMKYAGQEISGVTDWLRVNGRHWYGADNKLMAYSTAMDSLKSSNWRLGVYNEHEEYWYDALGRRIRTRVQRGQGCASMNRPSGCRNEVVRTIWDSDQILGEIKTPGEAPEAEGSSGPHFGRVAYVHGGGIDKPLVLARMDYNGTTVAIPHENFRDLFDSGTCVSGPIACDQIEWPAGLASAYMELSRSDSGETNWFGGLIAQKADASGLMYMRNRYMDPKTGTFTQPDPLGLGGGLNSYGYVNGDPVSYRDPFGLACPPDCGWEGDPKNLLREADRVEAAGKTGSAGMALAIMGVMVAATVAPEIVPFLLRNGPKIAAVGAAAAGAEVAGGAGAKAGQTTLAEGQVVLTAVRDGKVVAQTANVMMSHARLAEKAFGSATLPDGAWVGTVGKVAGQITTLNSKTMMGNQAAAPSAIQDLMHTLFK